VTTDNLVAAQAVAKAMTTNTSTKHTTNNNNKRND
jgi:hypothetical protein